MGKIPTMDPCLYNLHLGLPVAGESAWLYTNRQWRGDGTVPGIVYCAGKSAGAYNVVGAGFVQELCKRGYPIICGDLGDIPSQAGIIDGPGVWGCNAALAKIDLLRLFLINEVGAANAPIAILGGSHGGIAAYAYARNYRTHVSCVGTAIGTVDVEDIRVNNRSGYAASILGAAAYVDNTTWQAARPTHNPVEVAAWLASQGTPMIDFYSLTDPICVPATHVALKTAAGSMMDQYSLGSVGHSFTGLGPLAGPSAGAFTPIFADWVEAHI